MTLTATSTLWSERADLSQRSVDSLFGAPAPQLLHNRHPFDDGDDEVFNYWWLAHLMDARLDAAAREPAGGWIDRAIEVHDNIVERNDGSLFNDYFDDMLWFALATLRLHEATGDDRWLGEAVAIFDHVIEFGWNDELGESLAWRKQQLYYKNTPANGPLVILGARLHRVTGEGRYLDYARRSFDWITRILVDPDTGFVEDGVNREQDGEVDRHWRFTYNQGLYIGAAVELHREGVGGDLIPVAARTARTAIRELGDGTVFTREGDGGDEGLFKGVFYRYLGVLLPFLDGADRAELESFVESSTDALWRNAEREGVLRPGNDWSQRESGKIAYSTMLSAVMATELRATLEAQRAA